MKVTGLALGLVGSAVLVAACGSSSNPEAPPPDGDSGTDGGPDVVDDADAPPPLPPAFARWCGDKAWRSTFTPGSAAPRLAGTYKGGLKGLIAADGSTLVPWKAGWLESMKFVPEHPFAANKIRIAFARGSGPARIHLMNTFGRSYPGVFATATWLDAPAKVDLIDPIDIDVAAVADPDAGADAAASAAQANTWIEVPIPETLLEPTQHYMVVYEHLGPDPSPVIAIESKTDGDVSRWLACKPKGSDTPSGDPGYNYRVELLGNTFCAWTDAERGFSYSPQPFSDIASNYAAFADLNGDGHEDLALAPAEGGKVFFGDGKGGFTATTFTPFADVPHLNYLLFGDIDNDGDTDAYASQYVQTDSDGDGYGVDVDCDDRPADTKTGDPGGTLVHPGAAEVPGNGKDDDCNGTADDGTSTADKDGDGYTIAGGDCDDTRKDVHPGAPELLDSVDNDCNGKTDEIFFPKMLFNDGTGKLTWSPNKDVEVLGPSTSGALLDGDGDGLLDLYAGYWLVHYPDDPVVPSHYYQGKGKGVLADVTTKAGFTPPSWFSVYGVSVLDWNNDGLPDIYVSNYHQYPNFLWKNLGGGSFTEVAASVNAAQDSVPGPDKVHTGGHSYQSSVGDIDGDGDLDIFVPNISHPRVQPWSDPSMFLVNQGSPGFSFDNKRKDLGILYDEGDVNSSMADFDNDGDLDLFVITTYEAHYPKLYRNDGAAGFVDVTYEMNLRVHQAQIAVWADVDEDGDLDLVLTGPGPEHKVNLFINHASEKTDKNHWLEVDLQGTTANRDAIGARVTLKSGGQSQLREVFAASSHQSSKVVHFGLGKNTAIDTLTVRWPGGATETIAGAKADGHFKIIQGSGKAVPR